MLVFSATLGNRYRAKVTRRGPEECWPWTAATGHFGHGSIFVGWLGQQGGQHVQWNAHRVGWMLEHGDDPGENVVRHGCDWPPCQNPAHWELGEQADNVADMVSRGRARPVHAKPGEQHHAVKLSEENVADIRRRVRSGEPQKVLAAEYGMSKQQISRICSGQRWSHTHTEEIDA